METAWQYWAFFLRYGDFNALIGNVLKITTFLFSPTKQVGKEHPEMNKLVELTKEIKHKDESAIFKEPLDPNKLLPGTSTIKTQKFDSVN